MQKPNLTDRISHLAKRISNKGKYYFSKMYFKLFKPRVVCNICGWGDFNFHSDSWHPHTVCPQCQSQVRQRLFWAVIDEHKKYNKENLLKDKGILHVAPEENLRRHISKMSKDYKTADFFTEGYQYSGIDYNIDITDMPTITNETFDCVIVFDVLEHVSDDKKALKELNRILKPGGTVILTVPMKDNLKITYEDATITDPKQRELAYGQFDHLRIYGEDFVKKVSDHGFDVDVVDHTLFDEATIKKHVLFPPVLSLHPLATNYRKIYFGTKR